MTINESAGIPAEFTKSGQYPTDRRSPGRWLVSHFVRYWPIGVMMAVGAFGNAALAAVVPVITGQAFDAILQSPPQITALAGFAWTIVITQTIRGVLQLGRNFGAEWLGQLTERNIRDELYASLLGKSMTFHNLQLIGDTMARATNDVREINFMYSPGINLVIGSFNFMILPFFVAPRYHQDLLLTPILFTIAYILALWQYLNELQPITEGVRGAFGTLNTRLAEAIDGIETVKGMAQEDNEVALFGSNARRFRDAFVYQGDVEARFLPLLLLGLADAGGLLHALILFGQELISLGDVIAYFGLLQLFMFPTFVSLFAYSQVSLGMASAKRILDLINRETDLDQNLEGKEVELHGAIEFKDVSFAYQDGNPVLEGISFKVKPGQTVAIVGQTGAGKTSLVKLVNRTYDTSHGQILVDGVDVRQWKMQALRRSISIIEQDIFLFSRTVAENIAFGHPGATQEQIEAAAQAAQAHDFIVEFKDGYQTVIGERGVTLSGGQRQRLALARAFLTNPHILILDDSTSAIDSATEDKIQRAIYAAAQGRTTLIITHRLSQIRWADLIVVMRHGRVAAVGGHEELLASSEAYRRIFNE
ncbi:MAG: ABC transporter ATP-binding protein/permease [Anaerolineae bacterium]|nr:ABC transporter ATP-binding protein/permease [Anaerolineae bacterium]